MTRHVLLFGASKGIGRAAARQFAQRGARLTIVARQKPLLEELASELRTLGSPEVDVLPADLDDAKTALQVVGAQIAKQPVHVVVHNSGGPPGGPLIEASEAQIALALNRLVLVPHAITKLVVPGMLAAGFGRIINVVSTSVREPIPGLGVSNIARAAVAGWSKTLARELPPGITVNNVLPGYTDTERMVNLRSGVAEKRGVSADAILDEWLATVPEKRLATADEVASAIVYLASEDASFIRGVSLAVDGGRMQSI